MISRVISYIIIIMVLESLDKFREVGEKVPFALDTYRSVTGYA